MNEFSLTDEWKSCYFALIPQAKSDHHVCLEPGVNKHDFPETVRCFIILPTTIEEFLAEFSTLVSVNREKRYNFLFIF